MARARGGELTKVSQEEGRKSRKSRQKDSKSMALGDNNESKRKNHVASYSISPSAIGFVPHERKEVINQKYQFLRRASG